MPSDSRIAGSDSALDPSSFMSMIAKSGLWTFSHSSADSQEAKDPPTDKPASSTSGLR